MELFSSFSMLRVVLFLFLIGIPVIFIMKGKKRIDSNELAPKKRLFSFDAIIDKVLRLLARFPIAVLLVIGFSVLWFIQLNSSKPNPISYQLWVFFSIGALLSAAATLFVEDFWDKIKQYGSTLAVVLLWGVYCLFLPENHHDIHLSKWIEIVVIGFSSFFSLFFISFLKKNNNRAFWNFATQTLSQMVLAVFFGAVIFGGLSLAIFSIDNLFNTQINSWVHEIAVFCFALFTPFYFLSNIPDGANKFDNELAYNKMQKIFALYILTPILAIYAIILYVYLLQIIVEWQLPRGMVSWLVTALASGGLLVTTLLYPVREAGQSKIASFLGRWFGVIILPLLVLMTIGIFRRIGDHGITINRLYILLLNVWFYGIYLYLFFTRSRNIKWIVISPIIVALIASTSVWSVTNITERTLTREIRAHLGDTPRSISETREIPLAERERIGNVLEYMDRMFGRQSIQPFFTDPIPSRMVVFMERLGLRENVANITRFRFDNRSDVFSVVEGYNAFMPVQVRARDIDNEIVPINIPYKEHIIFLPMREIILEYLALNEAERSESEWIIRGEDYAIMVTFFVGEYNEETDEIILNNFSGYLFFNR